MKYAIYDILLHIFVVLFFPWFIFKMITARKYREGIPERFGFISNEKLQKLKGSAVIWVHAVSVGETKAILPVLKLFRQKNPDIKILFSTVTQTGNRVAEKEGAGIIDSLIYFPFDLSWVIRSVARYTNPKAFVVVEKEIWPNAIRILSSSGIPVIISNGTISDRSFKRFLKFKFFFGDIFGSISSFCARTAEDHKKAMRVGVKPENAKVVGNLKFEVKPPAVDASYLDALRKAIGIKPDDKVLVAGSTHAGEEEIILNAFKELKKEKNDAKLILAPRHPERFSEVEALIKKSGLSYSKRSSGGSGEVVMLDTVGELMTVFSFASVALVGGSLVPGIGGHNLLEPAFFGKPVIYGKHLTTYMNMAQMLEAEGGGIRVADQFELAAALKSLFSDEAVMVKKGASAKAVVEANRGAAIKTVEVIEKQLRKG
ncbi:MAG: 3-deoxy-D-manno-octulosonic acid transferase [Deltaproteobacteria bacterium]|nr:3-deoxy-D-manno-octulosonic acid transferase [Deltaproteobacteria bacterium]